jgi:hypothetical protein
MVGGEDEPRHDWRKRSVIVVRGIVGENGQGADDGQVKMKMIHNIKLPAAVL